MSIPVLDTGALIAVERRNPRMVALADEIVRNGLVAYVPSGVVAQCWRGSPRQHPLARLLRSRAIRIDPLDDQTAFQVGVLLGRSKTSDVVDGHVALLARQFRGPVFTSDPDDLRAVDPTLDVVTV